MAATTSAGARLAISIAAPATNDAAGFGALTFTRVGGVEQLGAFGAETEMVNFQPLDGPLQKYKGPINYGGLSPVIAHDDADAGQTILRTSAADRTSTLYSFEITFPDGAKRWSRGRTFGYPETVGAANTMLMANPRVEFSTEVIRGVA